MMRSSDFQGVASRKPSIYLVGSIRDDYIKEDVEWRERVIDACGDLAVFLNPLGGKTFNPETKAWSLHGLVPGADLIVQQDFWCVDHADILLCNFTSLSVKYPTIGSLIEFGRSTGRSGCLRYSIIDPGYTGHDNKALFKLHPFIEKNSAIVFYSIDDVVEKLPWILTNMSGLNPHFGGIVAPTT